MEEHGSTPKKSSMVCAYWIPAFLSKTWEAEKKAQKRSWSKLNSKERFPSNGCFQEYHLVYCLNNLVVSSSGSFANQFTVMGGIWAGCQNPFPKILRLSGDPVKTLGTSTVTKKIPEHKKTEMEDNIREIICKCGKRGFHFTIPNGICYCYQDLKKKSKEIASSAI